MSQKYASIKTTNRIDYSHPKSFSFTRFLIFIVPHEWANGWEESIRYSICCFYNRIYFLRHVVVLPGISYGINFCQRSILVDEEINFENLKFWKNVSTLKFVFYRSHKSRMLHPRDKENGHFPVFSEKGHFSVSVGTVKRFRILQGFYENRFFIRG